MKKNIALLAVFAFLIFFVLQIIPSALASSCKISAKLLQHGSKGASVTCLQEDLSVTPVTGYFGNITKSAVIAYQNLKNLKADGVVGKETITSLNDTGTSISESTPDTSIATPVVTPTVVISTANENLPTGCSSDTGYSITSGISCAPLPAGCSSTSGWSSTTGESCASTSTSTTTTATLPAGCTSTTGWSPTTGQSCSTISSLPVGCTSTSGWSSTTGQACSVTLTYPAGCTSTAGWSPTTGESCSTASSLPTGCSSTSGWSPTTGQACSLIVIYPSGCTSNVGYSTTTAQSCATATTLPAGCTSTTGWSPTTGQSCTTTTSYNNPSNSTVSFSQNNVSLNIGQTSNVTLYGALSSNYYVSNNSNSSVASATINGNTLSLYGYSDGSSNVSICSSGATCSTLYVNVP